MPCACRRPLLRLLLPAALLLLLCSSSPLHAGEAELAPLAERTLLLDGQVLGDQLIAVGERGHILVSADAGRSWRQSPVPTRVTLTSVFFVDDRQGWAAGHDATILRTRDGGATWQTVYADPERDAPILDLWFRNARQGLAVGAYGLILVTSDGGDSWQDQELTVTGAPAAQTDGLLDEAGTPGLDLHFNQLQATSAGQLYLAGEGGHLYRSDDGGNSWEPSPVPYAGSLFGTLPLDDRRLLAFGLRGHLFYSADGGRRWQAVETGTDATLNDAVRLRDGRIVLVGLAGAVLVGTDSGPHFEQHAQPDRAGFSRVLEAPDGALILLGAQGARRLALPPAGGP
jgi:photosystem II stability/assembly factor-like uncharacterized protein